jgi:Mrp family chromosome partitioning ATPase
MSRLADALRRAEARDPAADLLRDAEYVTNQGLWGITRSDGALVAEPPSALTAVAEPEPVPVFTGAIARKRDELFEKHLGTLVDRVFLPTSGDAARFVAFASTGREVHSGRVAVTAAAMLAERTTRTVCLLDANFRAPWCHQYFGLANAAGLAEGLGSGAPLADRAQRLQGNLWAIPAGGMSGRPSLDSATARQRITELVKQFDYVLVDIEPMEAGSQGAGLLRLVDGVIVVVAADSTRRENARRATQALAESGVTVIGAVLTNRQVAIPDALLRLL